MEPLIGLNGEVVEWPDGLPVLKDDVDRTGEYRKDHEGWRIKRIFFDGDLVEAIDFGPPRGMID